MKGVLKSVRDKSVNNLVVAILLGFGTWNLINAIAQWWNQGPADYWHGQIIRAVLAYIVILVLAEFICLLAKEPNGPTSKQKK